MAKLYIAIYKPRYGNYKHWALFLEAESEHFIFEVIGEHGSFTKNTVKGSPTKSNRHETSILVATINEQDVPEVRKSVALAEIDNETTEWNCQDYVIEVLERLYDECVIDEDDKSYKKGSSLAKKNYFGPM